MKIKGWREDFDCDNFARLYVSLIQACHAKADTKHEGVAVGEFWYDQNGVEGHAIVIAKTDEGWTFIEPQSGAELCLTDAEKQSSWFVYF